MFKNVKGIIFYVVCILLILSFGCASRSGYQNTYKTLKLTKGTIENLGAIAKEAHKEGLIDDILIIKIRDVYKRLHKAQLIVIEKQKELLDIKDTLDASEKRKLEDDIKATTGIYARMVSEFINLALEAGIIGLEDVKEE